LPLSKSVRGKWKNMFKILDVGVAVPSVQLYELGGLYFVRDGNHRVSVLKHNGARTIDAEVTSLSTEIEVGEAADRYDLRRAVIAYERRRFLEALHLIDRLPDAELEFSATGRFDDLVVHIACHRERLRAAAGRSIEYTEAAVSWYETIYLPVVKYIRDAGVMRLLPDRYPGDLYVWLVRHWDAVVDRYSPGTPAAWWARARFARSPART
jgi:hypothetical protein